MWRVAVRSLLRRPLGPILVAVELSAAIAVATTALSIAWAFLIAPLPFERANELYYLQEVRNAQARVSTPKVVRRLQDSKVAAIGAFETAGTTKTLRFVAAGRRLSAGAADAQFFRVLSVKPARGRLFEPGETHVALLTDTLWQQLYNGRDPIGDSIVLNNQRHTIVGVLPRRFSIGEVEQPELWIPYRADPRTDGAMTLQMIVRIPGDSPASAVPDALRRELDQLYPRLAGRQELRLVALRERITGAVQQACLVVVLVGVVVLVLAGANAGAAIASELQNRRYAIMVRSAVGGTPIQVSAPMIVEMALILLVASGAGLALAVFMLDTVRPIAEVLLPRIDRIHLSGFAVLFALGLCAAVAAALAALIAARVTALARALHVKRTVGRRRRARPAVIIQIAAAVVIAVAAGVSNDVGRAVVDAPLGFDPSGLLTVHLNTSVTGARDAATVQRLLEILRQRLPAGTVAASASMPFLGTDYLGNLDLLDAGGIRPVSARFRPVSSGWFSTLGLRLLDGRLPDATWDSGGPAEALVSESFVKKNNLQNSSARLIFRTGADVREFAVVGVVSDAKYASPWAPPDAAVYVPLHALSDTEVFLALRSPLEFNDEIALVRETVASLSGPVLVGARPMSELVRTKVGPTAFYGGVLGLLALASLIIAIVGVYSVTVRLINQMRHEAAVRVAVGSTHAAALLACIGRHLIGSLVLGLLLGVAVVLLLLPVLDASLVPPEVEARRGAVEALAIVAVMCVLSVAPCVVRLRKYDPAVLLRSD